MNNRRKLIVALGSGALMAPFGSFAQQQGKVWRLGFLDFGSRQSMVDSGRYAALIEGLHARGYVEGKNFVLEVRFAEGNAERVNEFAAELVQQKVDLILASGLIASRAVQRTKTVTPVVVTNVSDPVRDGLAASLPRPGGSITGMTSGSADTAQKLLMVVVPNVKRIAVINNPAVSTHASLMLQVQAAAKQGGKQVLPVSVRTPDEIERGFATMASERVDALIILLDAFMLQQRAQLAALALKHRLPSIYPQQQYAEAGGLMSYGADTSENFRRAGIFVDKISKGAKPGDIPFEQPTRYYLVINRKTANALGVKISNELLTRADPVIE